MGFFDASKGKAPDTNAPATLPSQAITTPLRFYSTASMERGLDGTEETYARYFWQLYHCSPDEPAGINDLRDKLRREYPKNVAMDGKRFVLTGEPAYLALGGYYRGVAAGHSDERQREYYGLQFERIKDLHEKSQRLPVPIDLTEGQLAKDDQLEFFACLALLNGHVV